MSHKTSLVVRLRIANALNTYITRHPDNSFEFKDPNMSFTSIGKDFGVSGSVVRHIAGELYGTYRRTLVVRRDTATLASLRADLDFIAAQLGLTLPSQKLDVE